MLSRLGTKSPARALLALGLLVGPLDQADAAPGDVTQLRARVQAGGVVLEWLGDSTGIGGWNIERAETPLGTTPIPPLSPFRRIVSTGAGARAGIFPFRFNDTQLPFGRRYCYRIQPQRPNGLVLPFTSHVCADLPAPPTFQPFQPAPSLRSLRADLHFFRSIKVQWKAPVQGVQGYRIEREDSTVPIPPTPPTVAVPFRSIATVTAPATTGVLDLEHEDRNVAAGNRYCYRIRELLSRGGESTPSAPYCLNFPRVTPPPAASITLQSPRPGDSFARQQPIPIAWTAPPAAVSFTVTFATDQPLRSFGVQVSPTQARSLTWTPPANVEGSGRLTVYGLDHQNQTIATGEVAISIGRQPPSAGGARCSSTAELTFNGVAGRRSGWYSGAKTFRVNLAGNWQRRGIRFRITPGDGQLPFFCRPAVQASMTGLRSLGYPSDREGGKPQPDGSTLVETDDVGVNAFFSRDSGTIFLQVNWPPAAAPTCNSPSPCFFLEMTPLPR